MFGLKKALKEIENLKETTLRNERRIKYLELKTMSEQQKVLYLISNTYKQYNRFGHCLTLKFLIDNSIWMDSFISNGIILSSKLIKVMFIEKIDIMEFYWKEIKQSDKLWILEYKVWNSNKVYNLFDSLFLKK